MTLSRVVRPMNLARLGTEAVASPWGGSPLEYRVDELVELDVVDDDDLGPVDVDDLRDLDDD